MFNLEIHENLTEIIHVSSFVTAYVAMHVVIYRRGVKQTIGLTMEYSIAVKS